MHEAILYEKDVDNKTRCRLCRHRCTIKPGNRGICGVRENRDGVLYSLVYDQVAAQGVDPIEKKPFFHFLPGTLAFSIATMGCNFSCSHCQNCHLSRTPADTGEIQGRSIPPEKIVEAAVAQGCSSLSYTYSEPTVFGELVLDTARIAKKKGLYNTFVTNGFATPDFIREMTGLIDAANVDLKAFSKGFYRKVCHADLEGVLDSIRLMHAAGIWLEITTLLIPGLNDGDEEVGSMAEFIVSVSPEIPWHISRYHPAYRMHDRPATPVESLERAREIGFNAGLRYVYAGNVPGNEGENTCCHNCGALLIRRYGFTISKDHTKRGACQRCHTPLSGLFQ
jgi:pyruvate formate lyase activating enzyme